MQILRITILPLLFVSLIAFNGEQEEVNIISTSNKSGIISNKEIKKGMTGFIIQNGMMIGKAISIGDAKVIYQPLLKLRNRNLASIKVTPKSGDKIIFGLYNFRGLIIAPNQKSYLSVKRSYPSIQWIDSDIFLSTFKTKPSKDDFQNFCSEFNIGFIDFILGDKEYIVDSNSFYVLEKKETTPYPYPKEKPFFTNYSKVTKGFFESSPKNWVEYYKTMLKEEKK